MSPDPKLSFVIVNYNTVKVLQTCLSSVLEFGGENSEITVVDNHSSDGSVEMVDEKFSNVKLLVNPDNYGFPRAVNQGIHVSSAPYLFILNSDVFLTKSTVEPLVSEFTSNPHAGFAAPLQFTPANERILSVHQDPTLFREWVRNIFFYDLIRYRLLSKKIIARMDQKQTVDWVMGAALLVKKEMVDEIGGMDENFFMFGEELDWQLRGRNHNWQVVFVPQSKVIHDKGASVNKELKLSRYAYVVRSGYYVSAKHYGRFQLPFFVLAQLIGSILRMIIGGFMCIFQIAEGCYQYKEHKEVIKFSLSADTYRWISQGLQENQARSD